MGAQAERLMLHLLNISLLWSVCEGQSEIYQLSFQTVQLGHTVTMTCHINSKFRVRLWCKVYSRRLQLLASTDTLYNLTILKEQSGHYSVRSDSIGSHLTISAITRDDVGTYFCGVMDVNSIQFGSGTFLMITGANMISDSVVQQPESMSVQSGGSVTLSCSVHSSHCAEEHASVKWLKNSPHSAPQMIHSSGKKCQKTESGATTCEYNLLMRNLSLDDAGTYYCVVTSCEQTLSGNGSRIHIYSDVAQTKSVHLSPAVLALLLSNITLGLVTLLLVWMLCKKPKKDPTVTSMSSNGLLKDNQNEDGVIYASVSSAPRRSTCRSASVKYSQDSIVYSDVHCCQRD